MPGFCVRPWPPDIGEVFVANCIMNPPKYPEEEEWRRGIVLTTFLTAPRGCHSCRNAVALATAARRQRTTEQGRRCGRRDVSIHEPHAGAADRAGRWKKEAETRARDTVFGSAACRALSSKKKMPRETKPEDSAGAAAPMIGEGRLTSGRRPTAACAMLVLGTGTEVSNV